MEEFDALMAQLEFRDRLGLRIKPDPRSAAGLRGSGVPGDLHHSIVGLLETNPPEGIIRDPFCQLRDCSALEAVGGEWCSGSQQGVRRAW